MWYPVTVRGGEVAGPSGYTYGAVVVRSDAGRADVLAALREVRFSGWLGRPADGWLVAVAAHGNATVAARRRGVLGVGAWLADRLADQPADRPGTTVLAVRVVADRQLVLAVWVGRDEVGRYVSDPSHGTDEDDDILPDPLGVEHAAAFAAACGHPETAEDLTGLLAEQLDPEMVIESERLVGVLRLLGLPRWLVAVSSLPRDVPTGPRASELTRLGAGRPGALGRVCGRAADLVRRWRPPPPAVADPPRGAGGVDPWLL